MQSRFLLFQNFGLREDSRPDSDIRDYSSLGGTNCLLFCILIEIQGTIMSLARGPATVLASLRTDRAVPSCP